MLKGLGVTAVILLLLALVILGPFIVIWALNTLFGLGIAYTFWTWLAVIVLGAFISPNVKVTTR